MSPSPGRPKGSDPAAPEGVPDVSIPLPSPRVVLETLVPAHAAEMFPVLADPAIYHHLDYGPPASVAALQALYTRLEAGRSPDGHEVWLNWLVRRLDDGTPAGYVQATVMPGRLAWVGYVFAPRHWGQGLASEAMREVLARLARDHPVPQLLAVAEVANTRSIALLTRLGFEAAAADDVAAQGLTATERLYRRVIDWP